MKKQLKTREVYSSDRHVNSKLKKSFEILLYIVK